MRLPRWWRLTLVGLTLIAAVPAAWGLQFLGGNFHPVSGQVYRSGQLGGRQWTTRLARHRIRSVINLRGPNPCKPWYQNECAAVARAGVAHHDLPLVSDLPPSSAQLRELVRLLDTCPKPLLIHCESGATRTGLAVAVYLLLTGEADVAEAQAQLSLRYGHWPWGTGSTRYRRFFDLYRSWLAEQHALHSPTHFRRWACTVYRRPDELGAPDSFDGAPGLCPGGKP